MAPSSYHEYCNVERNVSGSLLSGSHGTIESASVLLYQEHYELLYSPEAQQRTMTAVREELRCPVGNLLVRKEISLP